MAYIDSGMSAGSSVIVIARAPFLERLKERWLPLHADRFISLDAADTLSKLLQPAGWTENALCGLWHARHRCGGPDPACLYLRRNGGDLVGRPEV